MSNDAEGGGPKAAEGRPFLHVRMESKVYLDHNATTPVDSRVREAMRPYLEGVFGNPSAAHALGREAKTALETVRETVAGLLGTVDKDEVVFVSSGTEADNLALAGAAFAYQERGRHIITTAVEHSAVLETCAALEKWGFSVTYLSVDGQGMFDLDELRRAIQPDTIVVSVMHANNETGVLFPLGQVGAILREREILFHTDAVQSFGKVPLHVRHLNIDLLSISAHKIYGPKGGGALFVRRGVRLQPVLRGGGQERGRRAGTENIPAIVGLGEAARLMVLEMGAEEQRLRQLRDRFESAVLARVGGVRVNGQHSPRLAHTSNLSFDGIEGQTLVAALDLEGVAVSGGSACHVGNLQPSHVLRAMGLSREQVEASIRFSLGRLTADKDIDRVLEILPHVVERLRQNAPVAR